MSSHGNTSEKSSIPGASSPPARRHYRNAGSHGNVSLATKNNESFVSSGGLDSGFGLEEEENANSSSRPSSQVLVQAANNERTSSYSGDLDRSHDTSGSFQESSASALEDSTEMSYYKEIERLHREESVVRKVLFDFCYLVLGTSYYGNHCFLTLQLVNYLLSMELSRPEFWLQK